MKQRSVTVRTARWSAAHPWRALILWVVFVAAAVGTMSIVSTQSLGYDDNRLGQSGVASKMIEDAGLSASPTESVIITADSGRLDAGQAAAAADSLRRAVGSVKGVSDVAAPITSADGKAVLVPITMAGNPNAAADHVGAVLAATHTVQKAFPDLRVEQATHPSMKASTTRWAPTSVRPRR